LKNIINIFLFLISFHGLAQNFTPEEQHEIDSLNNVINNPNSHDTAIAGSYLHLSGILYVSNMDTMIPLCNKIITIANKHLATNPSEKVERHFKASLSGAYNNIGFIHMNLGNIEKTLFYLNKSLEYIEELEDKKGLATGLNNIGYIYNNQGNISKALENYHKSLTLEEELGNKMGIATSLNNIAGIYKDQGDDEKAFEYFEKSLALLIELKNKKGIASVYNSIGSMHDDIGDTKKALQFYFKGLEIQKEIGNKVGKSDCLNNIGFIYFQQGNVDDALIYYYKSLEIREEIGDKDGVISSSSRIAKALLHKGNISLAKRYALQSFKLSKEIGYPRNIKFSAEILSQIYEKENNNSEALKMLRLFITMNDSINNEETKRATAKQQAKYEYEKQKLIDDSKHDKLIAIEKTEKKKQKITIYTVIGGLLLVVIFLLFVFNRLKITRKQKDVIESQKEIVEKAHFELEEKNKEILDSINYAKRIQSAILPPDNFVKEHLPNSFIIYKPKDIVAGDFYWVEYRNKKVLFAVADCTGHGVPGAMVSVVCNNALNRSVREHGLIEPGRILDKSRKIVIEEFEKSDEDVNDGMDIALCALKGNKLEFAGANNPLWIIRDGEINSIIANKQPIGKFDNALPYTNHSIDLQKGDSLYIFTDGFVDQFGGPRGKKFMYKPFRELLLSIQDQSMENQKIIIEESFNKWKGNLEQIDDVCVIGVRI
jgi:serine phosphatase RsbU (regulator of sigma subunit)/Tfp pilus assembly protein PilF